MTTVTVSAVGHDDIDALVTSVAGLFTEDAGRHDPIMNIGWPASEGNAYYSGLLSDPDCLLLLARHDSEVIGHLVGRLSEPNSMRSSLVAALESMRIAPSARRAGAGSLLVEHFFAWARERGARHAIVTAYAANDAAQRFYARHGFAPQSVISRAAL